jgi:hypothetical protein
LKIFNQKHEREGLKSIGQQWRHIVPQSGQDLWCLVIFWFLAHWDGIRDTPPKILIPTPSFTFIL